MDLGVYVASRSVAFFYDLPAIRVPTTASAAHARVSTIQIGAAPSNGPVRTARPAGADHGTHELAAQSARGRSSQEWFATRCQGCRARAAT